MNLDDNELFIYQRLFDLVSRDLPVPDLVVYLQAPTELLEAPAARARQARTTRTTPLPTEEYLAELSEAYNHFFFHYTATPLLVVETSQLDLTLGRRAVDDLLRQIRDHGQRAREYYVPR